MNYHAAAASAVKLHVHVYVWAHSQDFLLVVVVGRGGGTQWYGAGIFLSEVHFPEAYLSPI